MNNFKKTKNGITLIALVITVVVLLILSGTVISMTANKEDLFSKTENSVSKWNEKVLNEEETMQNSLNILDMVANPDLAKYKLTVKVNEDGTVESPYYVNYPSARGTIKCRVLYNDSTYGLQIIAVNPVETVTIGKNDSTPNLTGEINSLERAESSYNRAILTLNEKAEAYLETTNNEILATDARCVGSNPLDKNYPDNQTGEAKTAAMLTVSDEYTFMEDYNGKFYKSDNNYRTDQLRLAKIDALKYSDKTNGAYFLYASRQTMFLPSYGRCNFCLPLTDYEGKTQVWRLWAVKDDRTTEYDNYTGGIRPVFTLSTEAKIIRGEGTDEVPFELGL